MSTSLNLFFRKPLLVACLADAEDNAGNARIIGTIEGAVGDQSGPWHALSMTHQGETASTASWSAVMGNLISYSKGRFVAAGPSSIAHGGRNGTTSSGSCTDSVAASFACWSVAAC
jgi:hypothetical protein